MKTYDGSRDGICLLRVDLNSPVEDGEAVDNARIRSHSRTIERISENNPVVVLSHQGRLNRDDFISLESHSQLIDEKTDCEVNFESGLYSGKTLRSVEQLEKGEVMVLENTRFSAEETVSRTPSQHSSSHLVQRLSGAAGFYVNDGFEVAHRSHASVVGFPHVLPSFAGPIMQSEYKNTKAIREEDFETRKMLLGGSKPSEVLRVVESLADTYVDEFLVGGVPAKLFLKAKGVEIGEDPLVEKTWRKDKSTVERILQNHSDKIVLPEDFARIESGARISEEVGDLSTGEEYMDIGDNTVHRFLERMEESDAVFMKGAPGVFEEDGFETGTRRILNFLGSQEIFTVVGGGDTANALQLLGIDRNNFNHVSLAGGAYVRSLAGDSLPGIEALSGNS